MKTVDNGRGLSVNVTASARGQNETPRLALRAREVAQSLGIGRASLYSLVASGRFPRPVKLGRSAVWLMTDIEAFLSNAPRGGRV